VRLWKLLVCSIAITLLNASCDRAGRAVNDGSNLAARPVEETYPPLSFNDLANFKYDTYEVLDEVHGGRPITKSDDVIPPRIKAYDGKRVMIEGYIMPLRLKSGLVTEFLLFRDQAACCFGAKAQMNHYIRVKVTGKGFEPGSTLTHKVWGTIAVGEIYVQNYLTGIYQMTADRVEETR